MLEKINKPIKLRKEKEMPFNTEETKQVTRFDLEQEIMSCWSIIDDLNVVSQAKTLEEALDIVESISKVYGYKFDKCFSTFEELIKLQKIK